MSIEQMHFYLTGGTGFIGSNFIKQAVSHDRTITAIKKTKHPGKTSSSNLDIEWITGDLASWTPGNLSEDPQKSALIHFAAFGVSPQPCTWDQAFQFNVLDSLALFQRAIQAGIQKIIVCGSCVEYGRSAERYEMIPTDAPLEPIGAYAASKAAQSLAAAALCREAGIELAILRLFTVYGEGQHECNFWPSLKKAALAGEDFPMTKGEQVSDFTPVSYAVNRILEIAIQPLPHGIPQVINIATGISKRLCDFAEEWWKYWGATGKLLPGSIPYRSNEIMRYIPKL